MKSKRLMTLALLGILAVGGAQTVTAFAQNTKNNSAVSVQSVSENKQVEVAKGAFEKYFNVKPEGDAKITSSKTNNASNTYGKEYSQVVWENGNTGYYANVSTDGQILDIGMAEMLADASKDVKLIDLAESKKIAIDFINEKKLINDVSKIEYLGEATIGPEISGVIYKLGNDNAVMISVNSTTKKVTAVTYETESTAQKSIEYSQFRQNRQLG